MSGAACATHVKAMSLASSYSHENWSFETEEAEACREYHNFKAESNDAPAHIVQNLWSLVAQSQMRTGTANEIVSRTRRAASETIRILRKAEHPFKRDNEQQCFVMPTAAGVAEIKYWAPESNEGISGGDAFKLQTIMNERRWEVVRSALRGKLLTLSADPEYRLPMPPITAAEARDFATKSAMRAFKRHLQDQGATALEAVAEARPADGSSSIVAAAAAEVAAEMSMRTPGEKSTLGRSGPRRASANPPRRGSAARGGGTARSRTELTARPGTAPSDAAVAGEGTSASTVSSSASSTASLGKGDEESSSQREVPPSAQTSRGSRGTMFSDGVSRMSAGGVVSARASAGNTTKGRVFNIDGRKSMSGESMGGISERGAQQESSRGRAFNIDGRKSVGGAQSARSLSRKSVSARKPLVSPDGQKSARLFEEAAEERAPPAVQVEGGADAGARARAADPPAAAGSPAAALGPLEA